MKISKKTLLAISGMLSTSALGLMFVSAADRTLYMNLNNAVQHINEVKIISTGDDTTSATLSNIKGLTRIDTEKFIIGDTGDNKNFISTGKTYSSILGGIKNSIYGSYNTILGGSGNIMGGTYNTIVGGEGNNLNYKTCGSYGTIIGGKNNTILGYGYDGSSCTVGGSRSSVIIGGQNNNLSGSYSVVMGNNSSVTGNNSVALGSGANIKANNSFLWSDGTNPTSLETNDAFVIMAQNGAIINSDKAHSFAKLTLGGALVLSVKDEESDIQCGAGKGGGIIKTKKSENNQLCLCSCDGSGWNSMFSNGVCSKVCNESIEPPQCDTKVNAICENIGILYSGSCINGKVVEGTGAYFVDKNDIVHRSCQTPDGNIASCTGSTTPASLENIKDCRPKCANGEDFDKNGEGCRTDLKCPQGFARKDANSECELIRTCKNEDGQYNPSDKNLMMEGFFGEYGYNRYMPLGDNNDLKRRCVSNEEFTGNAHSCTFTCAEGYECGYRDEGARNSSYSNRVAACVPINRCYGDYVFGYSRSSKTGEIIDETQQTQSRRIYKNPGGPLTKDTNHYTYLTSYEQLQEKVNSQAVGCFALCNTGTAPYREGYRGAALYETIEGPGQHILPYNAGYCLPNCYEEKFTYLTTSYYVYKGALSQRMPRQYLGLQEYNDKKEKGEEACLWTCADGDIPITASGDGDDRKYINELTNEDITSIFAGENHIPNSTVSNGANHICRHKCPDGQYFMNGLFCQSFEAGYTADPNHFVQYGTGSDGNPIINYTAQIPITCENGSFDVYTNSCKDTTISNERLCTNQNIEGEKEWFYWANGSCNSCPIGNRYNAEAGKCEVCTNPDAADCVKELHE